MTTDRELMQMALDTLEKINKLSVGEKAVCLPGEIDTAMDALRDRLAQPEMIPITNGGVATLTPLSELFSEPEPVAWMQPNGKVYTKKQCTLFSNPPGKEKPNQIPLYDAPPNTGAAVKAERKACVKVCDEQAEYWKNTSILEFAYQVAADEREACAEICDGISEWYETRTDLNQTQKQVGQLAAEVCGVRIRERGEK